MPRVNIWLPDELFDAVKAAGIPMSQVCQKALRLEVDGTPVLAEVSLIAVAASLRGEGEKIERALRAIAKHIEDNWED